MGEGWKLEFLEATPRDAEYTIINMISFLLRFYMLNMFSCAEPTNGPHTHTSTHMHRH